MKTRIVIGSLAGAMMTFQVLAQQVENDDMYFTSKDREKLKVENATASVNDKIDNDYKAFKKKHFDENEEVVENTNPTDSYSARTINPEYISRSNSEQASEDEQNYYLEGYTPATTYDSYSSSNYNSYNSGNYNNYNNNWNNNNGYYGNNYGYGSSLYSPYYGYCNPWMSPYYSGGSGLTMSFSYMWGSPGWNYGMNYGWGNSYYNPYSYYPSYGYPSYYGSSEYSSGNYGKRPSRHSAVVTPTPRSRERVSSNTSGSTNGRSRQTVDEYYVKPFRRTTTYERSADGYSSDQYTKPRSTDNSRTRESYNSNPRESRQSYSAPSRSSSGGSTPSRSSGSSSTPRSRGNNR
jgi:hypothetical protein